MYETLWRADFSKLFSRLRTEIWIELHSVVWSGKHSADVDQASLTL